MSEKQGQVSNTTKKDINWDIKEVFDRVREASLKDSVVANFAADLNKRAETQEAFDHEASLNKPVVAKFTTYLSKRVGNKKGQGTGKAKKWKYQEVKAKKWKSWGRNGKFNSCPRKWCWHKIKRLKLKKVEIEDHYFLFNCPTCS